MYLVDTNVVSAGAPRRTGAADLVRWMEEHSSRLFLSVVTVAEIEDGIAKAQREKAQRKAAEFTAWLEALLHLYASRIPAARIAGTLSDTARSLGSAPGFADIAIAAVARRHGLTILTRNTRHFAPLGVTAINPFDCLPTVN
jgi:predicted nucleic acid-binding protein